MTSGSSFASRLPPAPPELTARGISLIVEQPEHRDFLRRLYTSVRWEELAPAGWPDNARIDFLSRQFDMQDHHYKTHYYDAAFGVVVQGETPIGRLYLHQGPTDLRIVDISFLPDSRGGGIGTALLRAVFELGREAGTGVSIHVEMFNHGARRLYERLGFEQTEDKGVYHRMDWFPPGVKKSAADAAA